MIIYYFFQYTHQYVVRDNTRSHESETVTEIFRSAIDSLISSPQIVVGSKYFFVYVGLTERIPRAINTPCPEKKVPLIF